MTDEINDLIDVIPDESDYYPDTDVFRQTFFNINPIGDFNEAYRVFTIRYEQARDLENPEGNGFITYKYMCKKYIEYINWWNSTFGDKDPKYVGKNDKLKDPEKFFDDMLYNRIFAVSKTTKDYYIFGTNTFETLRRKLSIFKKVHLKQDIEILEEVKIIKKSKPVKKDDTTPF